MPNVSKTEPYELIDLLHEGKHTSIYRGRKIDSSSFVILKILKKDSLHPHYVSQLQHEYEISRKLKTPYTLTVYGFEQVMGSFALVMEDVSGVSLGSSIDLQTMLFEDYLQIAIDISTALGMIHQDNVIHKDIKPHNILVNTNDGLVKIIDFSLSTQLSHEVQQIISPDLLEGTLAYISPEQTGRMNRAIDYRTDIYSFGVLLYQMFTKKLPFKANTAMEMVHQQIASIPVPPHEVNPTIPKSLSLIILKCLAKRAEDRYHSAYGLKNDLMRCLQEWKSDKNVSLFFPGLQDVYDHFQVTQKLYGRNKEIKFILKNFEEASRGESRVLFLKGYSGVGKTSLINEIYKPIIERKGYFISGKCEQFKQNSSYYCLIQAFQNLIQQLLAESDAQLLEWKNQLLNALSSHAQIIIDIIPDLKLILGKQPPVDSLDPNLNQNRLNYFLSKFIEVFLKPQHPLVICLEDLHWIDEATLKFLQYFMCDLSHQYLFIIGSYRSNEVDAFHPLNLLIDEMVKASVMMDFLEVPPLKAESVQELIQETFHSDNERTNPLATLLYQKTQGNPFFVHQYLNLFYRKGYFNFDAQQQRWMINIEEIEKTSLADNVADLLIKKVDEMSEKTKVLLPLAAAIGSKFDLNLLTLVYEKSSYETETDLEEALKEEFIIKQRSYHTSSYSFQHDKIQQVFYQLIPLDQLASLHFKIGKILFKNLSADQLQEQLFEVINHLNYGVGLQLSQEDKDLLVKLNVSAGLKAKESAAYTYATNYLEIGQRLLPEDKWSPSWYNTTYALYENLAFCKCIQGVQETAEKLFDLLIEHTHTIKEKARIYQAKAIFYSYNTQYQLSIHSGLAGLKLFGLQPDLTPGIPSLLYYLMRVKLYFLFHKIEDLAKTNPPSPSEEIQSIQGLYMAIINPLTRVSNPTQMFVFVLKLLLLSTKWGINETSAVGITIYSLMLCSSTFHQYLEGYRYSLVALDIAKRFPNSPSFFSSLYLHYSFIDSWKNPIRNAKVPLNNVFKSLMERGEFLTAIVSLCMYSCLLFIASGEDLNQLFLELDAVYQEARKYKAYGELLYIGLFREICLVLMGKSSHPTDPYPSGDEGKKISALVLEKHLGTFKFCHLALHVLSLYLHNQIEEALELSQKYKTMKVPFAEFEDHIFSVYYALTILASPQYASSSYYRRELKHIMKKISRWAEVAPHNYAHYYHLIQAELFRVQGETQKAEQAYDEAIEAASQNQFHLEHALAYELAGKFYLEQKRTKLATFYLREAFTYYTNWGLAIKVKALEDKYGDFIQIQQDVLSLINKPSLDISNTVTTRSESREFDVNIIVQASQAISKEIFLDQLIQTLMRLVIINAGADKAFLIMAEGETLFIQAEIFINQQMATLLKPIPLEERQDQLSTSIVKYVAHSQQIVLLQDATNEGQFTRDPYVSSKKPFSLLCIPLLKQGKLIGILYLENNLNTGVFTQERTHLLNLLSAQMAISLENAQFYTQLESKIAERTQELKNKNEKLEQALKQLRLIQDQMIEQEKLASLGLLTSGIAHEIKNPLNFVINFSQVTTELIQEIIEKIDQKAIDLTTVQESLVNMAEFVKKIDVYGKKADSIIESMLVHARKGSGKAELIDIQYVLNQSLDLIRHSWLKKMPGFKISMIKNYAEKLDPIETMPGEMERVFINLIDNACYALAEKAKEAGPTFAPQITITTKDFPTYISVQIKDNGPGISKKNISKIFEPFFSTKPAGSGTGLGLYITYGIITKQQGGSIEVKSQPNEYTEFTIKLPKKMLKK